MQPKVSIIIPCYNKVDYIGNLFDSVIAQSWNNIELVIVNDGSTDGTLGVISEYEPRFIACGFDVVLVDQENKGVATAVYEGFKRFSGDYVCQVDADDELDPEYVNTLATWLWENPDYDWAVCDMLTIDKNRNSYSALFDSAFSEELILSTLSTAFLLRQIRETVHEYMVRANYMRLSGLIDNYYCGGRQGTQEPQFILTLAEAGGKLKYIPKPLYKHIQNDTMMSKLKSYDDIVRYIEPFYINTRMTIEGLSICQSIKNRYLAFMEISRYKTVFANALRNNRLDSSEKNELDKKLLKVLKTAFPSSVNWTTDLLSDYELLYTAIKDNIYHISPPDPSSSYSRIIAWGVFGIFSKEILPYLKGTAIEPTDLWDIKGDGDIVKKPAVRSLTAGDLVLVLVSQKLSKEIHTELIETGCALLSQEEIWTYLSSKKLSQFYDGSINLQKESNYEPEQ